MRKPRSPIGMFGADDAPLFSGVCVSAEWQEFKPPEVEAVPMCLPGMELEIGKFRAQAVVEGDTVALDTKV